MLILWVTWYNSQEFVQGTVKPSQTPIFITCGFCRAAIDGEKHTTVRIRCIRVLGFFATEMDFGHEIC